MPAVLADAMLAALHRAAANVTEQRRRARLAVGRPANLSPTPPRVPLLQVKLLHENTYQ
jgi:hypothetical protein